MANGHGGYRPNSGRKPIEKKLSNYDKALSLLNDNIVKAVKVLTEGLDHKELNFRVRCAELLLKKALPDKLDQTLNISEIPRAEFILDGKSTSSTD